MTQSPNIRASDGLSPCGPSQQAVSSVPASIPDAAVIQSDRDAAAAMWLEAHSDRDDVATWQAEWMKSGAADYGPVVQAFARYRTGSDAPPAEQIGAMARRMLELAPLAGLRVEIGIKPAVQGEE